MMDADPYDEGYQQIMYSFAGLTVRKDGIQATLYVDEMHGLSDGQIAEALRDRWVQAKTDCQ